MKMKTFSHCIHIFKGLTKVVFCKCVCVSNASPQFPNYNPKFELQLHYYGSYNRTVPISGMPVFTFYIFITVLSFLVFHPGGHMRSNLEVKLPKWVKVIPPPLFLFFFNQILKKEKKTCVKMGMSFCMAL